MRKQYVNKFINNSKYFIIFFLVIYFLNFYLNIEKKNKIYLVLNNHNLSFFYDSQYFFCKELNNFYFSIDENECKDVEYLDEKYEFRDQAFPKRLHNQSVNLIETIEVRLEKKNLKSESNDFSEIIFRFSPSFYSLHSKDVITKEFSYRNIQQKNILKFKDEINKTVNEEINKIIQSQKIHFDKLENIKELADQEIIKKLMNIIFDTDYFQKKDLVFFSINLFDHLSNGEFSKFKDNYFVQYNVEDLKLLKQYEYFLTNLKINKNNDFKILRFYFLYNFYNELISNNNNFYKIYVLKS